MTEIIKGYYPGLMITPAEAKGMKSYPYTPNELEWFLNVGGGTDGYWPERADGLRKPVPGGP